LTNEGKTLIRQFRKLQKLMTN